MKNILKRKLTTYSSVAAGTVLVASQGNAAIVYTDVNPDDTITYNQTFDLDLNNDTIVDFQFRFISTSNSSYINYFIGLVPLNSNQVATFYNVYENNYSFVDILQDGNPINGSNRWSTGSGATSNMANSIGVGPFAFCSSFIFGCAEQMDYLGLKLNVSGNTYYGWVRVTNIVSQGIIIHDYAYNDCPNSTIYAGSMSCSACTPVVNNQEIISCTTPVHYNGTNYMNSTLVSDVINGANGQCDSIHIMKITIGRSQGFTQDFEACNAFEYNDSTYTSSQVLKDTLMTSLGCDSVITTNITIHHDDIRNYTFAGCDSVFYYNQYYYSSQVITDTLHQLASGCYRVDVVNLVIDSSAVVELNYAIDLNQAIELEGNLYNETGTYTFYGTANNGCDSITIVYLTVGPNSMIDKNVNSHVRIINNTESIKVEGREVEKIELFDLQGRVVKSSELKKEHTIKTNNLSAGIYLIRIELKNNEMMIEKIIIP